MTTSLVGALLIHLGAVACNTDSSLPAESLALIHNTAQLAHCAAQGKVGSGFDVSAAVWGSHLFRRFDKEVIQAVLDRGEKVHKEGASNSEVRDNREGRGEKLMKWQMRLIQMCPCRTGSPHLSCRH